MNKLGYEHEKAHKEGERNAASEAYFKARALILDTPKNRRLFEAGFDRGYEVTLTAISRTERIRQLLRQEARGMTSGEIAFDLGKHFPNFCPSRVWMLLKHDISKGRVRLADGLYYYNAGFDTDIATEIRAAEALLKRHGYVFTKTGGAA